MSMPNSWPDMDLSRPDAVVFTVLISILSVLPMKERCKYNEFFGLNSCLKPVGTPGGM